MLSEVKYVTVNKPGSCQAKETLLPLQFVTRARRCQAQKTNGAQRGKICTRCEARENV